LAGETAIALAPTGSGRGTAPVVITRTSDESVSRHLVVISTSLDAIARVFAHARALRDAARYQTALENTPDQVTSLLFFDFNQVLRLGEQTGLISSARLATLWLISRRSARSVSYRRAGRPTPRPNFDSRFHDHAFR
jgi:hypothetical protein